MKKIYMQPRTETIETQSIKSYLLSASEEGNTLLGSGGSARDGGVRNSDAKGRGEDSFEDLW